MHLPPRDLSETREMARSKLSISIVIAVVYIGAGSTKGTVSDRRVRALVTPFRAALRRRKGFDYWTLEVTNEQHNHGPASAHTHPTLRRMD